MAASTVKPRCWCSHEEFAYAPALVAVSRWRSRRRWGCLLVLRRMSLMGDAMAHALLPAAAVGHRRAVGDGDERRRLRRRVGGAAGRRSDAPRTGQRVEDASFAAFYLIALALGVLLISTHGSSADLMHVLFARWWSTTRR